MMPILAGDSREIDEEAAKEWEHTLLQNTMDKELHELNRCLEEKEVYFYVFNTLQCRSIVVIQKSYY